MLTDLAHGAEALARGARLLSRPGIRRYVIIPLLINLLLFGGLIWYGYQLFSPFVEWLMSFVPDFLNAIRWLIWSFAASIAALTLFFAFTPVANIVAAPFNALMSEKIEILLTGKAASSATGFGQMAIDSISSQMGKLVYVLIWTLGLFLLSLIPVINLVAPLLWILFGSWLLTLEYMDYPMGNHQLGFGEQKERLRRRRGLTLGFGGSVMVMTSIPLVNFFTMSIATAGATVLWVEQLQAR